MCWGSASLLLSFPIIPCRGPVKTKICLLVEERHLSGNWTFLYTEGIQPPWMWLYFLPSELFVFQDPGHVSSLRLRSSAQDEDFNASNLLRRCPGGTTRRRGSKTTEEAPGRCFNERLLLLAQHCWTSWQHIGYTQRCPTSEQERGDAQATHARPSLTEGCSSGHCLTPGSFWPSMCPGQPSCQTEKAQSYCSWPLSITQHTSPYGAAHTV